MQKCFTEVIEEIIEESPRYKVEAYFYVMDALHFTQNKLAQQRHVTGQELLEGIRKLGLKLYGPMARTVFEHWGVYSTEDFGHIVFNMVNRGLLGKTEKDSIENFKDGYNFRQAFDEAHQKEKLQIDR